MQDYYEILQVHPKADQEAIRAAYERMCQRYDPTQLDGAAEELVELARRKRDEIELAYAVLGDAQRRAGYDEEQQSHAALPAAAIKGTQATVDTAPRPGAGSLADGAVLDYRPLPPARRQERPRHFDPQPLLPRQPTTQRSGRQVRQSLPAWTGPVVVVGVTTFLVLLVSLFVTGGARPPWMADTAASANSPATLNTPQSVLTPSADTQAVNQFEGQIVQARQVAQQAPENVNAWINLGNALYDSVQVVREFMPNSDLYQERLPRWIEASEAYSQALALDPNNSTVRADLAASLCKYGEGVGDQTYIERGLIEAQRAAQENPQDARALLNLGVCLVSADPPQTQVALEQWRKVLDLPSPQAGAVAEAQQLIAQYDQ